MERTQKNTGGSVDSLRARSNLKQDINSEYTSKHGGRQSPTWWLLLFMALYFLTGGAL